ncbi:DUF6629 family protein [Caenimonas terrae]|uniref:DUF6629 family protein n=1 Tax=Caenimonas terrae TaxID=696074 RepID=A0ABW0NFH8_9BURK
MCFSATASFGAASVLLVLGALSLRGARGPQELPFAAIPLLFGIQQLVEGVIWLTFGRDAPGLNAAMTHVYSFFSHVLWPVFIPAAVLLIEPPGRRRRTLAALLALGLAVGAFLLGEMVDDPVLSQLSGGHVEYISPPHYLKTLSTFYLVSTTASLMLSSHDKVRWFGAAALLSFALAYGIYTTWFVSVWCFFAALLSAIVCLHLRPHVMLPRPA